MSSIYDDLALDQAETDLTARPDRDQDATRDRDATG